MKKNNFIDYFHYKFDNFMAKGTITLIIGLALVNLLFIFLVSVFLYANNLLPSDSVHHHLGESLWIVLMNAVDTGNVALARAWKLRLLLLFVTLVGIFSVSTLIGILSSGIEEKLDNLKKGNSRVIETGHIVILGWSPQITTIIEELGQANANKPNTCIVILSEQDKTEMDDTLKRITLPRNVRLVSRRGNFANVADLALVNIQTSRSVVILKLPEENTELELVKTLLAILNIPRAVDSPYHIVTQVQNLNSLDIIEIVGQGQVEPVLVNDLISRLIAQTSRQSGLSLVYKELLSFYGNEIYFQKEPRLEGLSYGQALLSFNTSAVIGIQQIDGRISLNPPAERILQVGEKLILISEDDDKINLSTISPTPIDQRAIHISSVNSAEAGNTLILGSSNRISLIIQQLEQYALEGSKITIAANFPQEEVDFSKVYLKKQTIQYIQGEITNRKFLESLNIGNYDNIIALCNRDIDPQTADAQIVVTLLHLRNIIDRDNLSLRIVSEIIDENNEFLAQSARADDFVIGEELISMVLAQVSEQKYLNTVFNELFKPEGSEIYLKPINKYVDIDYPLNFYTIVEAAKTRGESAIGYRRKGDYRNAAKSYGVVINPAKDALVDFSIEDTIIVLAENES